MKTRITELFDLSVPIIQAPMAGTATPALAAAVSNAGGLGSLGMGASNADGAVKMMQTTRQATNRPFNVNFFVHERPERDLSKEAGWIETIKPFMDEFNADAPDALNEIYLSFNDNDELFEATLAAQPPIVSFHFGLPTPERASALKAYGATLLSSVTNVAEAKVAEAAGMDAIVAQGFEAGGHRGTVTEPFEDGYVTTMALVPLVVDAVDIPVIAAGGIMNGDGIAAALALGAEAVQMGTAFISCAESAANEAFRQLLLSDRALRTELTTVISGRPARAIVNRFVDELRDRAADIPGYPMTYDAGKALGAAAAAGGSSEFAPMWAGQAAPLSRAMSAAALIEVLMNETKAAIGRLGALSSN
jgi:nitronate monooxygenase